MELESLVVPQANAAEEAGRLLRDVPKLWNGGNLDERKKLLLAMLDADYLDSKETRSIVVIKPESPQEEFMNQVRWLASTPSGVLQS